MSVKVYTFKGRALDTLTREELIHALQRAYQEIEDMRQFAIDNAEMETLFRRARQTLRYS